MKIPSLDTFSEKLPQLRARQAEVWDEINKMKAECDIIRVRLKKGEHSPIDAQQQRVEQILGKITR